MKLASISNEIINIIINIESSTYNNFTENLEVDYMPVPFSFDTINEINREWHDKMVLSSEAFSLINYLDANYLFYNYNIPLNSTIDVIIELYNLVSELKDLEQYWILNNTFYQPDNSLIISKDSNILFNGGMDIYKNKLSYIENLSKLYSYFRGNFIYLNLNYPLIFRCFQEICIINFYQILPYCLEKFKENPKLKFSLKENYTYIDNYPMDEIGRHGKTEILEWTLKHFTQEEFEKSCKFIIIRACGKGHVNLLTFFNKLKNADRYFLDSRYNLTEAVLNNNLNVIEWYFENKYSDFKDNIEFILPIILKKEYFEIYKFIFPECSRELILKYIHICQSIEIILLTDSIFSDMTPEIIRFEKCKIMDKAMIEGNVTVLEYYKNVNLKVDELNRDTIKHIYSLGDLSVIIWLYNIENFSLSRKEIIEIVNFYRIDILTFISEYRDKDLLFLSEYKLERDLTFNYPSGILKYTCKDLLKWFKDNPKYSLKNNLYYKVKHFLKLN